MPVYGVDDIAAGYAAGTQRPLFNKTFTAAKAAANPESGWLGTGVPVAGVASPAYTVGSGYTCDKSTVGALAYFNGLVQNRVSGFAGWSSQPGMLVLADRLWSCSGMGFAATTYTVTTPGSLPARITDNGVGCELWVEQFAAAGAASGTLTATYVEPGGTTGRTSVIPAVISAPVIGQMQQMPLQAGDTGFKQLTSVANSATWTSASWGMTILKRICEIPFATATGPVNFDWATVFGNVPSDACIMMIWLPTATTAPVIFGRPIIFDR